MSKRLIVAATMIMGAICAFACVQFFNSGTYHRIAGWALLKSGNPDAAIKEFEIALKYPGLRPDNYTGLFFAYTNKSDRVKAREWILAAVREYPEDPYVNVTAGSYYLYIQEDPKTAIEYLEKAKKSDPPFIESIEKMITAAYERSRSASATGELKELKERDIAFASSGEAFELFNKGNEYYSQGRQRDAIREYEKSASLYPDHAILLSNLACAYKDIGEHTKAVGYYDKALALDPKNYNALNGIGDAYAKLGDYEKGETCIRKAISLDPRPFAEYCNLGNLYKAKGDLALAIDNYNKALAINPDTVQVFLNLADSYGMQGDHDSALLHYQNYLKYDPGSVRALKGMGYMYLFKKDPDRALAAFDAALRYDPNNCDAIVGAGYCYMAKHERVKADQMFRKALDIDPKFSAARQGLAKSGGK